MRKLQLPQNITGVSMKSGLEDRNNEYSPLPHRSPTGVSMKSGLEDRNNLPTNLAQSPHLGSRLNEVRPGRPEQSTVAS